MTSYQMFATRSSLCATEVDDHPLSIAIYEFMGSMVRDAVVGTTFDLEEEDDMNTKVSFIPHDPTLNMHLTPFGPDMWLLYVGFPYDYQTHHYLHRPVDRFDSLLTWNNPCGDRNFVLIKVRVIHMLLIPKSFVMN